MRTPLCLMEQAGLVEWRLAMNLSFVGAHAKRNACGCRISCIFFKQQGKDAQTAFALALLKSQPISDRFYAAVVAVAAGIAPFFCNSPSIH